MQNRRDFLVGLSIAAFISGCGGKKKTAGLNLTDSALPGVEWPNAEVPPTLVEAPPPVQAQPLPLPSGPMGTAAHPIPRANWTRAAIDMRDINPMNGVSRITIHHEGYTNFTATDFNTCAARVELIRHSHRSRGFSDIGYHFVIDRAGRVYEGRDTRYQGAHVRNNNENNVGIMCIGNFNNQSPSDAQLTSLRATVAHLRQRFSVAPKRIYTHRELSPSSCPGKNLQPRVVALRNNNAFV